MTFTPDLIVLLGIIAFTIAAFAFELLPIDVVALTSLSMLLLFDLVSPEEAISGFSNPAVITVMMMFVLSSALVHSGVIYRLGHWIADVTGGSKSRAATLLLSITGGLSGFINNTAAVSVFMPLANHLAKHFRMSPSKLLLPLSWAGIFGGTCTLIGTSTNLLVSSLALDAGEEPLRMFEFLKFGSILLVVGLIYTMLVPFRLLPPRAIISSLTRKYHLSGFVTELKVPKGSKLVGRDVVSENVSQRFQMNVLEILRGKTKIAVDIRNTAIAPDDVLLVRGAMEDILSFQTHFGLLSLTDIKLNDSDLSDEATVLAEMQLAPNSRLIGQTLKELNFRGRFGSFVLALSRPGEQLSKKIALIPLRQYDTLLVFGPRSRVETLYERDDFTPLGERDLPLHLHPRWWIGASVIPIVVLLAATGAMPIVKASILAGVALVLLRCLTIQQVYQAIDWQVIFLLAAILPLGLAMQNTGLAAMIGNGLGAVGDIWGPKVLISVLYLGTGLLTSFFSNNATAVLMVPIALEAANRIGVDPRPLLMSVAYAASASFMTPVGYQTNTMVYGPGGYKFKDYMLFGLPLNMVFWLLATWLIPVFWPL